jgi:hypothetical protein
VKQLAPPYALIHEGLRQGRVIPFLGSGASLGSRQPSAWNPEQSGRLPAAAELAQYLARKTEFPEDEPPDLAKVAQYYNVIGGRDALYRELHMIFSRECEALSLHRLLAGLDTPLLLVTTNYDCLIECAFRARGRRYDLVVHTTDTRLGDRLLWWPHGVAEPCEVTPNKLDIDVGTTSVIYKMHGAVDAAKPSRDQYVITEDDYIDFLARMTRNKAIPAVFAEPFQTRHFLFLGYGLYDWNLRVVLNRLEKDLRRPKTIKSWAIQHHPRVLEQRFWQERGVEVYDLTIDEFVGILEVH